MQNTDYQTHTPSPQLRSMNYLLLYKTSNWKFYPSSLDFSLPLTPSLSLVSVKAVKYSLSWCFLTSQTPTASPLQPLPLLSQTCIAVHRFEALHFCMDDLQKSSPLCTWVLKALHFPTWKFSSYPKLHYSNTAAQPKCRNGGWGSPNSTPQQRMSYLVSHIKKKK